MKANNGKGNITSRDMWKTPPELFNNLIEQYNFSLDCCASSDNAKCENFCQAFELLNPDHKNMGWMNSPFSKSKEMFKHFFKIVDRGVAIYRCDNFETRIWQDLILLSSDWIFIPKGRVSYHLATDKANGRNGSRFPSALIGKGVDPPKYIEGVCLKLLIKGEK